MFMTSHTTAQRDRIEVSAAKKLCLTLFLLGAVAALSLLLVPLERLRPPGVVIGDAEFRLLGLINPMLLLAALTAAGCFAAKRVGLDAPVIRGLLAQEPVGPILRRQLAPAVAAGITSALVIVGYAWITAPWFKGASMFDLPMPLLTKLLFGGVVEELITRWGLMSLFVYGAMRLGLGRSGSAAPFVVGAVLAALLFAAGHLPMLSVLVASPSAAMVAAVMIGNFIPGFLFGVLFWKRGLEAAMIGHASAHAIALVILAA